MQSSACAVYALLDMNSVCSSYFHLVQIQHLFFTFYFIKRIQLYLYVDTLLQEYYLHILNKERKKNFSDNLSPSIKCNTVTLHTHLKHNSTMTVPHLSYISCFIHSSCVIFQRKPQLTTACRIGETCKTSLLMQVTTDFPAM